jgi:hypothetical protein
MRCSANTSVRSIHLPQGELRPHASWKVVPRPRAFLAFLVVRAVVVCAQPVVRRFIVLEVIAQVEFLFLLLAALLLPVHHRHFLFFLHVLAFLQGGVLLDLLLDPLLQLQGGHLQQLHHLDLLGAQLLLELLGQVLLQHPSSVVPPAHGGRCAKIPNTRRAAAPLPRSRALAPAASVPTFAPAYLDLFQIART